MDKLLKSLSDFHDIKVQKLESQITTNTESMAALKSQIKTLEENNHSQKLVISKLLDNVKELESYKSLYYKSIEQLKQVNVAFTEKENYWKSFKDKIKEKIRKNKALPLKTSQDQINSEDRYKVSQLLKGNRDLTVAQSMPWAQKQKDKESRPDYAYSEVVRKKDERKRMEASDCPCCKDFYEASGLPKMVEHEGKMVDRIQLVSRHRFVHKDPDTPEGYWDLDYNALYSTDEENDTKEGKRKRLDALEAQKKSKII